MTRAETFLAVLRFDAGYNTRVVLIGAMLLAASAGAVGVLAMLRRRALVVDAMAHATLPGLGVGFLAGIALGLPQRSAPLLLTGAMIAALIALALITWLARHPRVGEDSAMAATLAAMFGLGVALLSFIQTLPSGGQAGLESFLLGSTAGMLAHEAVTLAALALVVLVLVMALIRPFAAMAFDMDFATAGGLPVRNLDRALIGALAAVTVLGLPIAGIVLIVALMVIPAAAARFWSHHVGRITLIAALLGALSAYLGAALSATLPDIPTGATIVLAACIFFAISLAIGPAGGLLRRGAG